MEKKPSPEEIFNEARAAAIAATQKIINDNPGVWYPCGFAWVNIKPARGKFIAYLKEQEIGYLAYDGGWNVWNPSDNHTQWMDAKFGGALAFAKVLRKYGIKAIAKSRED